MAANSKQGTYLGTTLAGFTALIAGLVTRFTHPSIGWLAAAFGLALLVVSTAGFARLKQIEVRK